MILKSFISNQSKADLHQVYQLAKQVLVVDTSPLSIKLIADGVKQLNHIYVGSASTVSEVEEGIERYHADILFINCHLKGNVDGLQLAKVIKHDHDIPFYMMCAENDCESKKWSAELNPDGFIYLSQSPNHFKDQLRTALG